MSTKYIASNWRLPNQAGVDSYLNDNYGLTFSGSSEYLIIDSSTELDNVPSNPYSFSFWFKSSTAGRVLSEKRAINNFVDAQYTIHLESGYVKWYGGADGTGTQTSSTLVDDQWHHIACVAESTTVNKIYVDGILDVTSSANRINSSVVVGTFNIGANFSGGIRFIGEISEYSIFNYALSSTQVSTLYGSSLLGAGNPLALKPAPVAYYPLGDNTSGNPLTQPNEAVEDASVFDFPASNDFISIGSTTLGINTAIAISAWFKTSVNTGRGVIINEDNAGNKTNWNLLRKNDDINFIIYHDDTGVNSTTIETSTINVSDNNWHHVVGTWDGTTNANSMKVYFDGIEVGQTTPSSTGINTEGSAPWIGNSTIQTGGYFNWTGQLSNIQVWNTALSSSEITTLYNSGVPLLTGTQPQASNLKAWYKLDQSANWDVSGSGYWDIPDASGNGNDGISSGMTSANLVLTDLTRNLPYDSYSFNFDGAGSVINLGNTDSLKLRSGDFTFSVWINPDSWGSSYRGIYVNNNTNGVFIGKGSANIFVLRIFNISNIIAYSTLPATNTWTHICITRNNGLCSLFYNGSSVATATSTHDFSGLADVFIGSDNAAAHFDGKISNVSIINEGLTSTQVMKLYSNGMPQDLSTFTPAPIHWWTLGSNSFFNGSNFICKDLIGSNDGTSVNAGVDALQGNTPRSEANGTGTNMDIPTNLEGTTKYSSNNSWSINMSESARVADTP